MENIYTSLSLTVCFDFCTVLYVCMQMDGRISSYKFVHMVREIQVTGAK